MSKDGQRGILPTEIRSTEIHRSMISSIQIRGYRGFLDFEMSGLERVNLLVGTNNSGKTSVLEALHLLASRGEPFSLWQVLQRRGERLVTAERGRDNRPPELDICHLFSGHEIHLGSKFVLIAKNQTPERHVTFTINPITAEQSAAAVHQGVPVPPSRLGLHITGKPAPGTTMVPLSASGGLSSDSLNVPGRLRKKTAEEEYPAQFITTESIDGSELVLLWDTIALTANENRVLDALRFLEPDIERIAAQSSAQGFYYDRGGFLTKFKGQDRPIPIGSMGDGMWRMLAMAIAITRCKGGVLLVDEIDTGLHYSVLTNMWKVIFGAAKELDVQVFATTHSSDCIKSLAELIYSETDASHNVTLQRVEMKKSKAIPYTDEEIAIAAEKGIEVR